MGISLEWLRPESAVRLPAWMRTHPAYPPCPHCHGWVYQDSRVYGKPWLVCINCATEYSLSSGRLVEIRHEAQNGKPKC